MTISDDDFPHDDDPEDQLDGSQEWIAMAVEMGVRGIDLDLAQPIPIEVPGVDDEAAALRATVLIERARILVDWVGRGRTITRDAAIRRQDAADLMLRGYGKQAQCRRLRTSVPALPRAVGVSPTEPSSK